MPYDISEGYLKHPTKSLTTLVPFPWLLFCSSISNLKLFNELQGWVRKWSELSSLKDNF